MNDFLDKLKNNEHLRAFGMSSEESINYAVESVKQHRIQPTLVLDYVESVSDETYLDFISRCEYVHQETIPDASFFIENNIKFATHHTLCESPLVNLITIADEDSTIEEHLKKFAYVHSVSNWRRTPNGKVMYSSLDLYTFKVRGVLRSELDTLLDYDR